MNKSHFDGKIRNVLRSEELGACEGSCEKDSDCVDGLVCFQRPMQLPNPPVRVSEKLHRERPLLLQFMNDTEKKNHIENMSFMCGKQKIDVDLNKLRRQYWPFVKTTGMGNWIQLPPTSEKCPSYLGAKDTDNLLFKSRFRVPDAEYCHFCKKIVNKEYDNEKSAFVDPQDTICFRVCQPECADTTRCTSEEIKEQCTYSILPSLRMRFFRWSQKAKRRFYPCWDAKVRRTRFRTIVSNLSNSLNRHQRLC